MTSSLIYLFMNFGMTYAATCAPALDAYGLSRAEVTSSGTYWHVDDRLHLFWDRRADRRQAVTVSWDARARLYLVEAFLAQVTEGRVDASHFARFKTQATNIDLRRRARWRRTVARVFTPAPRSRSVRYETVDAEYTPLTAWASVPHTEESLGVEVPARRLLGDQRFASALITLITKTMRPKVSRDEAARLLAAVQTGFAEEVR